MNYYKTRIAFIRKPALHAALVAGALVFAAPFLWLVSTSAKTADELFPPRWLPPAPPRVIESPYIALRDNERPERPPLVNEEDWDRVAPVVRAAIRTRLQELAHKLPAYCGGFLEAPDLTDGLFGRLLREAPDALFAEDAGVAAAWFLDETRLTMDLVREVFDAVYRRIALSEILFVSWKMDRAHVNLGKARQVTWEEAGNYVDQDEVVFAVEGAVRCEARDVPRPAQEVSYSFRDRDSFRVRLNVPLDIPASRFRKVSLTNHGDRSWHEIWVTVDLPGEDAMPPRRYRSTKPAYAGTDRWQETTWQVSSDLDFGVDFRNWVVLEEAGAPETRQAGRALITIEYRDAGSMGRLWNKYLSNYRDVLRRVPLWGYVRNSLVLVILNIVGQVLGSSLVAFAFARLRWPGRDLFFVVVLATLMIPPQVTMIPVFLIFKTLGFYNTLRPLWAPAFFGGAFYIFLLRQFMRSIPRELEDSAKIDGCGYLAIYARIILPLIKPAIATISIFTFLWVWNDFMGPLIYIADQELYPLSLGLFALQAVMVWQAQHGIMMAAAVLMTLPVVLLFFAAQRQFIQGVTLTGLKG